MIGRICFWNNYHLANRVFKLFVLIEDLPVIIEKLLIVENQYYLEMDQARRHLQVKVFQILYYYYNKL